MHLVSYLFWGVLTTLVNIAVFHLLRSWINLSLVTANLLAWAAAVLFAFFSNRRFVFASEAQGFIPVSTELARFTGSRVFSGALDMILMLICVTVAGMPELPSKIAVNVIVVLVNYLTSFFFVFRKRGN